MFCDLDLGQYEAGVPFLNGNECWKAEIGVLVCDKVAAETNIS